MARLLSVNVGLPRDIPWQGKTVHTGIWKTPVRGRRMVRRLNIDGDGQGDLQGHGGEHRAVFVYQIDSYRYWQAQLGRTGFAYGQFCENFTVDGLPDTEVCIGDRYRIGSALFEVTQPRVTCYRVGIRMNEPQMAALLVAHGKPGFYLRVLEEGEVGAGDEIEQEIPYLKEYTVFNAEQCEGLPDVLFQLAEAVDDLDFRNVLQRSRSESERLRAFAGFTDEYVAKKQYTAKMKRAAPLNGFGHKPVIQ